MAQRLQIATLMYHNVSDDPAQSGFQRRSARDYRHSLNSFRENLESIASSGKIPELVSDIDFDAPGRHLLLTFDDGGKSSLHISDQLAARGWKGHFFVVTGLIGTATFLDVNAVRYIRSCGHIIGSHSHTHPDIFNRLSPTQMCEEWRISCTHLSDLLGEPCDIASVPGGDVSRTVFEMAGASNIRYLFTSEPLLIPKKIGLCWVLGRVSVKATTSPLHVRRLAQFKSWTGELAYRRAKVFARSLCFPLYKSYVRQVTRHESAAEPGTPL